MKKLIALLFIFFFVGCWPNKPYPTSFIYANFDEYKIDLSLLNIETFPYGDGYTGLTTKLSIVELKNELENAGYKTSIVEGIILISFPKDESFVYCFYIFEGLGGGKFLSPMLLNESTGIIPFPKHFSNQFGNNLYGDATAQELIYFLQFEQTFEDFLYFYNHSLADIINIDYEKQVIIVRTMKWLNNRPNWRDTKKLSFSLSDNKTIIKVESYNN